jgi:hypothetical protein
MSARAAPGQPGGGPPRPERFLMTFTFGQGRLAALKAVTGME